jgi:dihydroorotate dehydrogenase (NAD+) catalytic subunit
VEIPIIGVGGVESWRDAAEYMMAGATAVQIGSAIGRKGLSVFKVIVQGLQEYLEREGLKNIGDIVGVAHD